MGKNLDEIDWSGLYKTVINETPLLKNPITEETLIKKYYRPNPSDKNVVANMEDEIAARRDQRDTSKAELEDCVKSLGEVEGLITELLAAGEPNDSPIIYDLNTSAKELLDKIVQIKSVMEDNGHLLTEDDDEMLLHED